MTTAQPTVLDVDARTFDVEVLERSHEVPVLVDFWAPWCGPCKALAPTLERVAASYDGKLQLVKLNTDDNPSLAQQYRIRGIPNVKLFAGGKVVGEFTGVIPERAVRSFLDAHIPSQADTLVADARELLDAGKEEDAHARLIEAILAAPDHGPAHLELARLALARGDGEALENHHRTVSPASDEYETIGHMVEAASFRRTCEEAGGVSSARAATESIPDSGEAWYRLGCCLAAEGHHAESLAAFLKSVEHTRKPSGGDAHRALLTVFGLLGPRHPDAEAAKRRLQIFL